MRLHARSVHNLFAALTAATCFIATTQVAPAQEPLRWKFKVGDKLDYSMVQEMNMAPVAEKPEPGQPAPPNGTTMRQDMEMSWDVQGVNEAGEAVIKQKFERIKMKMATALGGFEYDSKSEEVPTGFAALIAPMYKAMTDSEFEITMTSRGEVKDVEIPPEIIAALKASPGAAAMGEMATEKGFKEMISKGALVLPENAPKEGETWSTKVEVKNPVAGTQTVVTTYTYEGTKEIDGTTYAVIKPELTMEFANDATGPDGKASPISMKIAEQSSGGEVLFNINAGRLYTTKLQQNVTIDATTGGQTQKQKIDQKIDVKVTPAGEKPADEVKAADEAKSDE